MIAHVSLSAESYRLLRNADEAVRRAKDAQRQADNLRLRCEANLQDLRAAFKLEGDGPLYFDDLSFTVTRSDGLAPLLRER